ncbi:helix-turn-helix domain-containing protein [Nocardioides sp. Bht2]|uniref:helix-turn-helix domain-containing protein n=1 Tax=Nocardioides sp. Bht2 TaxID=3392297 RepID=UPI0039B6712F
MQRSEAGNLLRDWRRRRRLSQLELASRAGVSARHVSFVENGRSKPTSAMILRLCDQLAVPLREQNRLLLAAGFAPAHAQHDLREPSMSQAQQAIQAILTGHLPHPALVIDSGWDIVDANAAAWAWLAEVDQALLEPPVNVMRLSLHPSGLAPMIRNFEAWKEHLLRRLHRQFDLTADPKLAELMEEFGAPGEPIADETPALVVPLELTFDGVELSLISTTTVFGTPLEVTLSELAIEAFYPANEATRAFLSM